ncbi:hypothetical protein P9G84_29825 [Brevibacillus centrosporus]|uniref:hypothetical protein n=1 Tax=Brevibacillus centrosporus TaxID=54910 RepID=UPI000F0A601E|nr:hypothetical protein [Brevibacillus centrosporus]MEC2133055.1 hypothetical protein [Brevibacillus centrosporus]RNB73439.1 hypothetical protein EDM55_00150 [Brevibacillus centrosporus]GED31838.1 hypothetical protein BCE02nite_29790 [Brevibacillus centrosporus]
MKWGAILGISLIVGLLIAMEWNSLCRSSWKTRVAYAVLVLAGWFIAILLVHNPDLPGMTQVLEVIYKPITTFLKIN